MNKAFFAGLAIGLVVGMLAISYSKDAQKAVEKGKRAVEDKFNEIKTKVEDKIM